MKAQLKGGLKALGLYERASRAWIAAEPRLIRLSRGITGRNRRLIASYLERHQAAKLHIGCGDNELSGWLNTELCPRGDQIFLDATARFPFADGTFHFIYTEHMIEHISLVDAGAMLNECFRVLAPGGVIRIVTPDLRFLATLLNGPPAPELASYIRYSIDVYKIHAPAADGTSVFNHFVRSWGHQYIHSESSLADVLSRAGFVDVERRPLNGSPHPELTGLAITDRMPAGFLEMESVVLEGRRPARRG